MPLCIILPNISAYRTDLGQKLNIYLSFDKRKRIAKQYKET